MDNVTAVKEKLDIVDVVNSYVPLKRAGKNYKANCPFHSEKTASFMVSPELQRYRCFGCAQNGDMFTFVMELEGVDFAEALKMLADKAGVELQYEDSERSAQERSQKQKYIEMNTLAAELYHKILTKHGYGKSALDYLIKKRGISEETINTFQLGYAPSAWDNLSKHLVAKGFTPEDIVSAGLGKFRKDKKDTYDMFRGRLMFPLIDHMGRVLGFSGRAIQADQQPKYINTPETQIYHKERLLYGLNLSKTYIKQSKRAIITEGQLDMVSPYQAGIQNVVASMGTALTASQAALLKRYTDTVVLVFDSDEAGIEAGIRGIDVITHSGLHILVAPLTKEYKDPDEMVQSDPIKFKEVLNDAIPIWDYYFVYALNRFNIEDIYERKKTSDFLLGKIKKIDDKVIQAEYIKKFAGVFEIEEEIAIQQMNDTKMQDTTPYLSRDEIEASAVTPDKQLQSYPSSEVYFLSILTELDPDVRTNYIEQVDEAYFSQEELRELYTLLKEAYTKDKTLDIQKFYATLQDNHPDIYSVFERIYLLDAGVSIDSSVASEKITETLPDHNVLESEAAQTLYRLKRAYHTKRLKEISDAMKKAENASDSKQLKKLQNEAKKHTDELAEIPAS